MAASLVSLGALVYLMMPTHYTTDMGNGVTVYADKYVNSGEWVYNCQKMYLVSRISRPFPVQHFLDNAILSKGHIWLSPELKHSALALIETITEIPDWYRPLTYSVSGLGEDSSISYHSYWLITEFENRPWVISVGQPHSRVDRHDYYITAKPYDPATHRTYERAMSEALTSCPRLQ
ncbi:hypothetical protein PS3A_51040 [Pseudomonas sp. 3A(2025)]